MLEETRPAGHDRARGLVSSRVSGARVTSRTFAPSPALAGVVDCLWVAAWDLRGEPPHVVELLADPCVNISFEGGDAAERRVVGVSPRLWRRELRGQGRVRALKLRAGAVQALWPGQEASRLTGRVLPADDLLGGDLADVAARVLGPEEDREGLAALEAWAATRLVLRPDERSRRCADLAARIAADPGITSVARVAEIAGLGERALQRLFREHLGAPPKWVIRRVRLQEAALRLERGEEASLAALAARLGYADQAHLARDFKAATGRTPGAFRRTVWGGSPDAPAGGGPGNLAL
ncbi:MAG: helix-turn-helix domain-containing protein [Thermoleophilia bacterium]|jgi:AraC-like DNA-binding protein|nr:helix-turn-helix domain-containing protein [Thermoleophilia bacterium]